MPIAALPTPPTRDDPANFAQRGDAFMAALPPFGVQLEAARVEVVAKEASAATSAATATTKADSATASEAAALASKNAAATSAGEALASKNAAATSETNAAGSAGTATTKAGEAAASAASIVRDGSGGVAGLTLFKLNLRNAANTVTSWFTTATTAARTWTMPDKDGTVAMTSDITGGTVAGSFTALNATGVTTLGTAAPVGLVQVITSTTGDRFETYSGADTTGITLASTNHGAGAYAPLYLQGSNVALSSTGLAFTGALNVTPTAAGNPVVSIGAVSDDTFVQLTRWSGTGTDYLGTRLRQLGGTGALAFETAPNGNIGAQTYTERMRFDSSGNLGLGVVPDAWQGSGPGQKVLQLQSFAVSSDVNTSYHTNNAVYTAGAWAYRETKYALMVEYDAATGAMKWSNAPSGTAGTSIGFSQRMALDGSGNLLAGAASGSSHKFAKSSFMTLELENAFNAAGSRSIYSRLGTNSDDSSSYHLVCETGGANRLFIYGSGNVVNTNNSYGAISDIKLKENIVDASPKLAKLLQVRIVNYNLKTDPLHKQLGVIAQELELVSPGLIEESPDYIEIEIEPARTETKVAQQQVVEHREDVRYQTTLVEGQWRKLPIATTVEVPLFTEHPLFDETGAAILEMVSAEQPEVLAEDGSTVTPFRAAVYQQATHKVPVTKDVEETVQIPAKMERQLTGTVTKSVKYSVFVPMLIKAMQEQQALIESLTSRLTVLESA